MAIRMHGDQAVTNFEHDPKRLPEYCAMLAGSAETLNLAHEFPRETPPPCAQPPKARATKHRNVETSASTPRPKRKRVVAWFEEYIGGLK